MRPIFFSPTIITLLFIFSGTIHRATAEDAPAQTVEQSEQRIGDAWPLDSCPVSGEKFREGNDPFRLIHKGREIRLCCLDCSELFVESPNTFLEKADIQIIEQQKDDFQLDYCIVMPHMKLAGREDVDFYDVAGNRLIINCCEDCRKELEKDPEKYLDDLDRAVIEKSLPTYPHNTCIVSGEELGSMGDPINYVHANRLFRFCCAGCIDTFDADPTKYMK